VVMDLKTPGSGEADKNRYENINALDSNDQIKFVITDRADYDWSRDLLAEHQLDKQCEVLFSPASGELAGCQITGAVDSAGSSAGAYAVAATQNNLGG